MNYKELDIQKKGIYALLIFNFFAAKWLCFTLVAIYHNRYDAQIEK